MKLTTEILKLLINLQLVVKGERMLSVEDERILRDNNYLFSNYLNESIMELRHENMGHIINITPWNFYFQEEI